MKKFVNRKKELATLQKEYEREEAAFIVLYGRRRVGKTALINEFCKDKRHLFFLVTEENEAENRFAFQLKVAEFLDNELLKSATVNRWEILFDLIAEAAMSSRERIIIAIDEFQYLGKANPAFPSILMNVWDQKLKNINVMLLLSGSLISMMTAQVLNYDSPLYGRRTAQMCLKQIPFEHYHEFVPEFTAEEQLLHYAVTGGVPKYIELFEKKRDIYEGIQESVLSRNAFLYAEPEFLLQKEVSEIGSYFSVLKAIAAGNHKLSTIASVLNAKQTSIIKYLTVLANLDIVERQVPITEENPEKSKKGLYCIKDNFISFWFRYVYPYKGMLEADQDEYVLQKIKQGFVENHVSYVYEEVCRQSMWHMLDKGFNFNRVGRWWGSQDVEIDIVAYDFMGTDMIFGECKYSKNLKGMNELRSLMRKASAVTWKNHERKEHFILFSKSGFDKELEDYAREHANIFLVSGIGTISATTPL